MRMPLSFVVFLSKLHTTNVLMKKHPINPSGGTFYSIPNKYASNVSRQVWETTTATRSLRRHAAKRDVVSWTGSRDRKKYVR